MDRQAVNYLCRKQAVDNGMDNHSKFSLNAATEKYTMSRQIPNTPRYLRLCTPGVASIMLLLIVNVAVYNLGTHRLLLFWPAVDTLETKKGRSFIEECKEFGSPYITIEENHTVRAPDQRFCRSRYEQHCLWTRRAKQYAPSLDFLTALREYEDLHQRCTGGYNLTELAFKGKAPGDCKYFVWTEKYGMGNQINSLVSAFIYSILTRRTLLIALYCTMKEIFCEPFPASSWLLPENFPEYVIRQQYSVNLGLLFKQAMNNCTSKPQQMREFTTPTSIRSLNVSITHQSKQYDLQFFCPTAQNLIKDVPWLFLDSHEYWAAGFYFLPEFRKVLNELFPDKQIFLHAARYLLNPNNKIWGRITRFYQSYLDDADMLLGIQVRAWDSQYLPIISKHILQCGVDTEILPPPIYDEAAGDEAADHAACCRKLAVVLTSLRPEYYKDLHETYAAFPNRNKTVVSVFSPSWDERQQTGRMWHDEKAIADMWLLSFTDDLIVTPRSSFGGVASGLSGIIPIRFLKYGEDKKTVARPSCGRSNLAGPCYMNFPTQLTCDLDGEEAQIKDSNATVREVRVCWADKGIGIYQGSGEEEEF